MPTALTHRPKQGFSIPLAAWLRGPLRVTAEACCRDERLASCGIALHGVQRLYDEHQAAAIDHGPALWALICLQQHLAQVA